MALTGDRVGATVRRPWEIWSSSVHAVLEHLADAGFVEAPQFIGRDGQGREILTFLEGKDSGWPLRPHFLTDRGAFELGCLVRRLGQALSSYAPADDAVWQFAVGALAEGQVLQHGDLGPWNIVWSGENRGLGEDAAQDLAWTRQERWQERLAG